MEALTRRGNGGWGGRGEFCILEMEANNIQYYINKNKNGALPSSTSSVIVYMVCTNRGKESARKIPVNEIMASSAAVGLDWRKPAARCGAKTRLWQPAT